MANSHRRGNHIIKMKINENWVTKDANLKHGIVGAFKSLLTNTGEWRANIDGPTFQSINEDEASKIENPFTIEEVFTTLSNLNGDKAPVPNGFTMAFWQFSYDIVKEDIMRLFNDFHDSGEFVKNLNATFQVLVPKKGGAEDFKDFRPTSLMGSLYMLLAKVLANRLKKVMHKLINKAQNAFVEGRQIMDVSLMANKVIDTMLKRKEKEVLCKLDIKKAYEQINWNCILKVMQKMGFGTKWIRWIKRCITTSSFSVLINGSPEGFFNSARGLRQGDPLSQYLFVIGMEVFSHLVDKAASGGFLPGFNIANRQGEKE